MATDSIAAAPLPLPARLVQLLRGARVRTAGHVVAVFGETPALEKDEKLAAVTATLVKVLGEDVPADEEFGVWCDELAKFLARAADRDLSDARRLAGTLAEERALALVSRRVAGQLTVAQCKMAVVDSLALMGAMAPPLKRWRTGRVVRRSEATDEDARKKSEVDEHGRWAGRAVGLLRRAGFPVLLGPDGGERDDDLLKHLFAKRRASTLRARVRSFERFLDTVKLRTGGSDYDVALFLAYLKDLEDEGPGLQSHVLLSMPFNSLSVSVAWTWPSALATTRSSWHWWMAWRRRCLKRGRGDAKPGGSRFCLSSRWSLPSTSRVSHCIVVFFAATY